MAAYKKWNFKWPLTKNGAFVRSKYYPSKLIPKAKSRDGSRNEIKKSKCGGYKKNKTNMNNRYK